MCEPSAELLSRLGARLVAPLGGRCNAHWLVAVGETRKVLRRWAPQPPESIEYERTLVERLAAQGWPVAPLTEPVEHGEELWSLMPFLLGEPPTGHAFDPRARGRLLAEFHAATAHIGSLEQRPGWRRAESILGDPALDRVLSEHEPARPEEVRIVRWHLERARTRTADLRLESRTSLPIHGDFAPWNLRYAEGRLSGLLDFELARQDHRAADFALAWRGKYDEVIHGYEEVSPLEPEEHAALVYVWWAELIEGACRNFRLGRYDDGWTMGKLLVRSPLMGADAEAMP